MSDSLVNADWLIEHLDDPQLVVLDCTVKIEFGEGGMSPISGRADFDAEHIPGARFADLITDLADTDQAIGFAMPTPEALCAAMGDLGVGDESTVVVYDSSNNMWAARVWWMLRWVGFDSAVLLDGGLSVWRRAGGAVTDAETVIVPAYLTPRARPELIADKAEVLDAVGDDSVQLVDTLFAEHFSGDVAMYERPGHIASAVNVSAGDLVDEHGCLIDAAAIASLHGDDPTRRTITYCGGGIAASLNAFALARAGFTNVGLYAASLQEWTADPDAPMAVGS